MDFKDRQLVITQKKISIKLKKGKYYSCKKGIILRDFNDKSNALNLCFNIKNIFKNAFV